MSDCGEKDFFWESWTSPGKRKRKKDKKCKNKITVKTNESIKKKKKKNSKFKEAMVEGKGKKKEKKKNKSRLADGSFIFAQASSAQANVKPETSNPRSSEPKADLLTQDSKKKTKRKKKVAFDLSPGYISAKRPKFVPSLHCPTESILLENEAVRDSESCSQVSVTGHSQGPTHDEDSQCTSEDINSQDLFITQKTFRTSPSEPSSGESSDKCITATPQMSTQQDKLPTSVTKQHLEGSFKCPQDSSFHKHHRKTNKHVKKPKTVQVLLTEEDEEEEGLHKAHHQHKNGKLSFQTQMELNANLTGEKKVLCPAHIKPSVVNLYLAEPIDANPILGIAQSKKHYCNSSQQSMTSTSTQTENFFTTELCSYLKFCQKSRVTTLLGDLKPLDLSLLQRARKDLGSCLSAKTSSLLEQVKGDIHKDPNLHPSCSLEVKKEVSTRHPSSGSAQDKGETSPQSEPKSGDTITSSDDSEPPCRTGKLDLTQVRAVQMKLNESFFFKTKGEGQSPRPESPLMKLVQSRQLKSRKGH